MKDKAFGVLQRIGRSFMLPIAILPIAGLFLGIGGSFTNQTMLETYGLTRIIGEGTLLYSILTVLNAAGSVVFDNLPLIFAVGVAIGMAKKEKEVAALAGAIAFFIMHASIGALIKVYGDSGMLSGSTAMVLGIESLQMGVFGGIIVGLGVAALHNRFYKIQLPQVLSFFGGTRFVPIISAVVYLAVGILMYYIWPPIQSAIYAVGGLVRSSGYIGTWIYGIMERALIPFGLHHVFYLPFWQTGVGGSATVAGQVVEGAQNIFFAELAAPGIQHFNVEATRFMAGKFPFMIFGLPGAALAMYKCARTEKKKLVGGLLLSAALTSMLTGITEPLEFTFLFVAPVLYIIHCVLAGLSFMLMHILNVGVGMTFSGGLIDMFLFGVLQGNAKTNWLNIVWVGLVYFVLYYFLFRYLIRKFNFKTPGREADTEETKLYTRADVNARKEAQKQGGDATSAMIVKGLGGRDNLTDVDCCATRLRITVKDAAKVSDEILKASGAAGVIKKGNGIQVIYGPRVTVIKSNLEDYLANPQADGVIPSEEIILHAPVSGEVLPLEKVKDDVFSAQVLGKGIAVEPSEGKIYAPADGTVENVFDTKHAIGFLTMDGVNLLIHVGLDTVQLNGKHFQAKVKSGDKVKAGDLLLEFDIQAIKDAGYQVTTPIVVCNSDEFKEIHAVANGKVVAKSHLLKIER